MKALWERIEAWFSQHAPDNVSLPEGAKESEIDQAESVIGMRFPLDLRESYKLHNGSNRIWLFPQGYLMPLEKPRHLSRRKQALYQSVLDSWKSMNQLLSRGILSEYHQSGSSEGSTSGASWSPNWLPITCNQSGDYVCIDLDTNGKNAAGQVIDWWHEKGSPTVLCPSFSTFLADLVDDLESGRYVFDERESAVKKRK
jgi:cell wall assembly regulator SMI1